MPSDPATAATATCCPIRSAHEDAASVRRGTVSLARAAGFARRVVRPDRIARQVRLDALVGAATAALWLHLDR